MFSSKTDLACLLYIEPGPKAIEAQPLPLTNFNNQYQAIEQHAAYAFIQSPGDYVDAEPTFKQSYAPQSGKIFGLIHQMKETFETNLSNSQKEEESKVAKEEEIKAGQDQIDAKTQELADTYEKNAKFNEVVPRKVGMPNFEDCLEDGTVRMKPKPSAAALCHLALAS